MAMAISPTSRSPSNAAVTEDPVRSLHGSAEIDTAGGIELSERRDTDAPVKVRTQLTEWDDRRLGSHG